jgi:protease I
VERVELEQSRQAVGQAGAETRLLSIHEGELQARNRDIEEARAFSVKRLVSEASVDGYNALLLPGGTVNADQLRIDDNALASCGTSSRRASW